MTEDLHDLVAPYALDALDADERARFERHLEECAECRRQLRELQPAAGALAYGVEGPEPPAALRDRILDAARSENGARVIPFPRRRWVFPATAAVAAAAAVAAVAVGLWAASLSRDLDRQREANADLSRVALLLGADPTVVPLADGEGSLLVGADGTAALAVCGLSPSARDKTYEAWVIQGETPRPAGLFRGGSGCPPVLLDRPVPRGAQVAVTLERAGGAPAPTGPILVRSERV